MGPLILEPSKQLNEEGKDSLQFCDSLITETGCAQVLISNPTGRTEKLEKGCWLGQASEATCIVPEPRGPRPAENCGRVEVVTTKGVEERKMTLSDLVAEEDSSLQEENRDKLHQLLLNSHHAFAIMDDERGETDLIQMTVF